MNNMIEIDIPQVAYKTWCIEYRMYDINGNRCYELERDAEQNLEKSLSEYKYSSEHDHVR